MTRCLYILPGLSGSTGKKLLNFTPLLVVLVSCWSCLGELFVVDLLWKTKRGNEDIKRPALQVKHCNLDNITGELNNNMGIVVVF